MLASISRTYCDEGRRRAGVQERPEVNFPASFALGISDAGWDEGRVALHDVKFGVFLGGKKVVVNRCIGSRAHCWQRQSVELLLAQTGVMSRATAGTSWDIFIGAIFTHVTGTEAAEA